MKILNLLFLACVVPVSGEDVNEVLGRHLAGSISAAFLSSQESGRAYIKVFSGNLSEETVKAAARNRGFNSKKHNFALLFLYEKDVRLPSGALLNHAMMDSVIYFTVKIDGTDYFNLGEKVSATEVAAAVEGYENERGQ